MTALRVGNLAAYEGFRRRRAADTVTAAGQAGSGLTSVGNVKKIGIHDDFGYRGTFDDQFILIQFNAGKFGALRRIAAPLC